MRDRRGRAFRVRFAGNLDNILRRSALSKSVKHGSLTTRQKKPITMGARVVPHSRCLICQTAEVAVPRELLAAIFERIQRFGAPPSLMRRG